MKNTIGLSLNNDFYQVTLHIIRKLQDRQLMQHEVAKRSINNIDYAINFIETYDIYIYIHTHSTHIL